VRAALSITQSSVRQSHTLVLHGGAGLHGSYVYYSRLFVSPIRSLPHYLVFTDLRLTFRSFVSSSAWSNGSRRDSRNDPTEVYAILMVVVGRSVDVDGCKAAGIK
jgi:hypothetical protein